MTHRPRLNPVPLAILALAFASACSTQQKKGNELAANGPSVTDTRVKPGTVELDRDLNPLERSEVVTEVKDFRAPVTEVRLRFVTVPIDIPMKHIGGTTWRAELSPRTIRRLAVGNQTTVYEARIVAKDQEGEVAMGKDPVQVQIKAPDLSQMSG